MGSFSSHDVGKRKRKTLRRKKRLLTTKKKKQFAGTSGFALHETKSAQSVKIYDWTLDYLLTFRDSRVVSVNLPPSHMHTFEEPKLTTPALRTLCSTRTPKLAWNVE